MQYKNLYKGFNAYCTLLLIMNSRGLTPIAFYSNFDYLSYAVYIPILRLQCLLHSIINHE